MCCLSSFSHRLRSWKPKSQYFTALKGEATVEWYSPTTLTDLTSLQAQFASAPPGTVKYVCGNTSFGVEKYFNTPRFPTQYTVRGVPYVRSLATVELLWLTARLSRCRR